MHWNPNSTNNLGVLGPSLGFRHNFLKRYSAPKDLFPDFINGKLTTLPNNYLVHIGVDDHLVDKILDPNYLSSGSGPFSNLQSILKNSGSSTVAWVGEAGGAYNSGHNHVTNAFVFSFW